MREIYPNENTPLRDSRRPPDRKPAAAPLVIMERLRRRYCARAPSTAGGVHRSRGASIVLFVLGALNMTQLRGSDRGDHVTFMISRRHVSKAAMLAIAFVSFATVSRSSEFREALWPVVQACRVNHDLTGAAFPCLEVNVSGGADRGYVILRPPFGLEDFILAPTRKIVGVEDRSLQAADAPNYFNDAWNARGVLATKAHRPPERDEVALAINSGLKRTQDQLHIHIGCISTRVKGEIQAIAPALSETRWRRLGRPIGGLLFWARRIDQETLAGVNPFRLVSADLPDSDEMRSVTIFVAGTRSDNGSGGFILFATINDRLPGFRSPASDLLDGSCSS